MSTFNRKAPRASALTLAALAACVSPTSLLAADDSAAPADPPHAVGAEVIVITASPISALTWETDPRLPRQPVPASDGADYLKTVPGFSAVRNGGTNGDPVLRGMFGSRLNVLSNDGAMPGACPARMDNPLSYVAPETYDKLVVIKGPQTVLWGPGASAGTVRFERETPHFDAPGVRANGSLLAGAFGRADAVFDATAGFAQGYARLSANHAQSDDYEDGNGDTVPSSWKKWNTDLALGWTPDADTVVEASAGGGDGEARYAGRSMDGSQFRRHSYGLRVERKNLGPVLKSVQASAYYNLADHVMDNYTLRDPNPMSSMPMPVAADVERRTQGGRLAVAWELAGLQLTSGLDAMNSRHRDRSATGRGAYRDQPWATDAELRNLGVFTEGSWPLDAKQRVIAGLRLDRAEATDKRETTGMMAMPNPTAGQTRKENLQAGFVRYERELASAPLGWYAGLGRTERMPDYWELFSADAGPAGAANAFAGIRPEKTTQLDVGAQYRGGDWGAWVSAYVGRIADYILFSYADGGMMGMSSSAANVDANIRGAEAGVELRPNARWKLGSTLAYAWGENASSGEALPQMPPLEARLTARYDDGRWSFGGLVRAVAAQQRVAANQGNVVGRDLGSSAGFVTLALNGGYRFDERTQLTAGVDNLFDRTYSEHLNLAGSADFGYPADPVRIHETGRNVWVKLNFSY
ncbi:TonB-dependent copper receptor [Rubrivivax gelatinosus]|uniref:TonB-dependent copper receptor n=1 Tax=Rubrivivax gelatinosus TaxID=28068 RepID=UPI0019087BA0|nr:TonB-dependent copper receptor [Rubrivivax gelatinosus]MBK1615307.1 TonB-dependent copper receptor [Rubrivivax gelatinosus]